MARRQREEDDALIAAYYGRKGEDPLSQAMQILKLQQGGQEAAANRAFQERQQAAQEFNWRQGRDIEERRLTADEKKAAEEAIARDVTAGTHQIERGEDVAYRTERAKAEDVEKEKARTATARKEGISDIDTMVQRELMSKEEARKRYEQYDPALVEIAKGIKTQTDEAAFKKGLAEYQALPPKNREKYKADSPEMLQRIKNATQGYTYEPGGPSAMPGKTVDWKPRLEPTVSEPEPPMRVGYGQPAVEAPPAYSYTTRAPQTVVPAVAGMAGPVNMSPIADLQNKLLMGAFANPRAIFKSPAEITGASSPIDLLLKTAAGPSPVDYLDQLLKGKKPEFEYLAGGPSAMPPRIY